MVVMNERPTVIAPTRLYLPSAAAGRFIKMFISRDTRRSHFTGEQQLNRFPANSYCAITWFIEGSVRLVRCAGKDVDEPLAQCVVNGCLSSPATSRCGGTHAFMAVFHPDAFHALFGIDLSSLQNRFADARQALPEDGRELVEAVLRATTDAARQELVERFVEKRAGSLNLPQWSLVRRLGNRITLAVASAMFGVGPRQLQRVALRQVGVNFQTLLRLARAERSYLTGLRQVTAGKPVDWAEHALASDYADQSHMGRDCKANTGRTPAQLARDVRTEEADWIYRLEVPLDEDSTPTRSA
jgi:AraC-like DNA-binding protein